MPTRLSLSSLLGPLVLLSFTHCAGRPATYRDFPAASPDAGGGGHAGWRLTRSPEGPDVNTVVAPILSAFYQGRFTPADLQRDLDAALSSYPDHPALHEVAAHLAVLQGDPHLAWLHFMKAAADVSAEAPELYLWEIDRQEHTASEDSATIALLREIYREHPRKIMRALAAQHLVGLLYDRDPREAAPYLKALGYMDRFLLIGAFDNEQGKGFLTAYPPEVDAEAGADLQRSLPGALVPVRWRTVKRLTEDGAVPLSDLLSPDQFAVTYLLSFVYSASERPAQLRLTTASAARVLWNDGVVLSEENVHAGDADNLVAQVDLQKGWNKLLIKAANKRGRFTLAARITDDDGVALPDLQYSTAKMPYKKGPEPAVADRIGNSASIAHIFPNNRRRFLLGNLYQQAGLTEKALAPFGEFLAAAPSNLLAQYHAGLAYKFNEEAGKFIDLLDRALRGDAAKVPAFLLERARFYRGKQQLDKAYQDLTQALSGAPQAREAQLELARLFDQRDWQVDRCRELQRILERWPDNAAAHLEHGECLAKQGFIDEATVAYRRAQALAPNADAPLRALLSIAARRFDLRRAIAYAQERERLRPYHPLLYMEEGDLRRKAGDGPGAERCYKQALDIDPDASSPWEHLAILADDRGQAAESLRCLRLALERAPGSAALAERLEFLQPNDQGFSKRFVPTDDAIEEVIARAGRLVGHPGADVAVLLQSLVSEVHADGSSERTVTRVAMALNERGRDALTLIRLGGGRQRIRKAYAIDRGGERQQAASIRGGEVRFRKLSASSLTVLQYVEPQGTQGFLPNQYVGTVPFQGINEQIEDQSWWLVLPPGWPADRALHLAIHGQVAHNRSVVDGRQVHHFSVHGVAPLFREPQMPPIGDVRRSVSVSSVPSWEDYVRWERALLSGVYRSSPQVVALAQRLCKGVREKPRECLEKLFHFVSQEIRYQMDYENTIAGVRPHACPVVLERGYGDCKDKSLLLIQLAKQVGIAVRFAILRTTDVGQVEREVPNQQFNHAIAYIPKQTGFAEGFFLDPTVDGLDMGNLRADDQGALSLVIDPETGAYEFIAIPYQAPELQFQRHRIVVKVQAPGGDPAGNGDPAPKASAHIETTLRGTLASILRRLLRNPEEAQRALQQSTASLFAGSTMKEMKAAHAEDVWQPVSVELDADVSASLQAEGKNWRLKVPSFFPLGGAVTLGERHHPLWFGATDTVSLEFSAELPPGYQQSYTPAEFHVSGPCFEAGRTTTAEDRRVTLRFDYRRTCSSLALSEYAVFRQAVQKVLSQPQEIVFGATPPPDPKGKPHGAKTKGR